MVGSALVFTAGSLGDIIAVACLATRIVQTLYDTRAITAECQDLVRELRCLHKTLILIHLALQRYQSGPIGECLAGHIGPEVVQCGLLLQSSLDEINTHQQSLISVAIASLWQRTLWISTSKSAVLRAKIRDHVTKFTMLLVALNTGGLLDLGSEINQIGTHIQQVHAHLLGDAAPPREIQDNTVKVVDALGESIPISDVFLSSWEAFHHVIKGYSRNRIGQRYIDLGQYEIRRPQSNQLIMRSKFSQQVKAGDTLEISIILHKRQKYDELAKRRCPRCSYMNNVCSSSWIKCSRCSGHFQVAQLTGHFEGILGAREANLRFCSGNTYMPVATSQAHGLGDSPQTQLAWNLEGHYFRRISTYCLDGTVIYRKGQHVHVIENQITLGGTLKNRFVFRVSHRRSSRGAPRSPIEPSYVLFWVWSKDGVAMNRRDLAPCRDVWI
ncbi:hypothetical protein B0H34DRAFT_734353 [Crassisporium funariophilum]|nr:hypothetical protein B0H34DRAFT_734353 [Crassisporium funariophilum]